MKRKARVPIFVAATIVAGLVVAVSCKKNADQQHAQKEHALTAGVPTGQGCASCVITGKDTLRGVISSNLTLTCDKIHFLDSLVYVTNNATLTIQAGAIIRGLPGNPSSTPARPGGGLVITKGAKIDAQGTATCPIVFTSYRDTTSPAGNPQSGDWSGIVLLGDAPTNNGTTNIVEGIPSNLPAGVDATYGGSDTSDNSGTLKYVRIQYAGFALSLNNEINGLTMAGVGCGTTIDFVEVYKANDDAFEWFGGTVNAKHLIAVDPLDDIYDFDNGYSGHIQFALGIADPVRKDQSTSNGIEADNNAGGTIPSGTLQTRPVISNMTLIGYSTADSANTALRGVGNQWRRSAGFMLYNSAIMGWKTGLLLDQALGNSQNKYLDATFPALVDSLKGNVVHSYTSGAQFSTTPSSPYTTTQFTTKATSTAADCGRQNNNALTAITGAGGFGLRSPFNRGVVSFYAPTATSLLTSGFDTCGLPGVTNNCSFSFKVNGSYPTYRGAFSSTLADDWASGWTIF